MRAKGMPDYQHSVAWRRGEESPARDAFLNLLREETQMAQPANKGQSETVKASQGE